MTRREAMLAVIRHEEVRPVPYTLAVEADVAAWLDAHYGNTEWRQRLNPYTVGVAAVDTDIREPIDATHHRDGYGGIWRTDQRPWHLETPVLAQPSFAGYTFPSPARFHLPEEQAAGLVRAEITRLCREMGRGGGFILAPAKPLQPETPTENAVAIVEAFAGQ
jgi:hypothetical protein